MTRNTSRKCWQVTLPLRAWRDTPHEAPGMGGVGALARLSHQHRGGPQPTLEPWFHAQFPTPKPTQEKTLHLAQVQRIQHADGEGAPAAARALSTALCDSRVAARLGLGCRVCRRGTGCISLVPAPLRPRA